MSKITTCTRWITCTGVPRKFGMVSLVGMPVNWRRLWESICLTFLTNNQTCFISLWVKVTALCYMVVSCLESGLGFLVQLLFGHVLVISFFFFFFICFVSLSVYITSQGNMFFLGSVIWTYLLVIPYEYFICFYLPFWIYVSKEICSSCHLLSGTVLFGSWKRIVWEGSNA